MVDEMCVGFEGVYDTTFVVEHIHIFLMIKFRIFNMEDYSSANSTTDKTILERCCYGFHVSKYLGNVLLTIALILKQK